MKREIKFRGKRKDNGEWVVGDLFTWNKYRPVSKIVPESAERISEGHEVVPETVGEYIGLRDMKGAEMYEGDRVQFEIGRGALSGLKGTIIFDMGCFDVHIDNGLKRPLWECYTSIEVIGNVCVTPDLFTQQDK